MAHPRLSRRRRVLPPVRRRSPPLRPLLRIVTVVALLVVTLVTTAPRAGASPPAGSPAGVRAFSSLFKANTTGNILLRGNTLMTCPAGSTASGTPQTGTGEYDLSCAQAQGAGLWGRDNDFTMGYVNTDAAAVTAGYIDSSSAKITIPGGATVLKAELMWSGQVTGTGTGGTTFVAGLNTAELKTPTAGYTAETSSVVDSTATNGAIAYQGMADVTSAVQSAGSGMYTVANVQSTVGGNDYAGWSLAIAYQDPTQLVRNLDIYSGFQNVNSSTNSSVAIPVSGFTTPSSGTVATEVGVVAWEGDRGNVGDGMTVGSSSLSNAVNPVSDVFNSTMSDLGTPVTDGNPTYQNTLGTDIDTFDATGALADGSTSTTVHVNTAAETYYPGLITFATNLNAPSLTATKTVNDVTHNTVTSGDQLNYSITVKNTGSDGSASTTLTDPIPTGATYKAGTLAIDGVSKTDGFGDDTGKVVSGLVTAWLGTGAATASGGTLAVGASTTVTFSATVNSALASGTAIANTAGLTYADATLPSVTFTGSSDTATSTVAGPTLAFSTPPAGQVNVSYSDTLSANGGTGPYTWSLGAGTLPPGLTLGTGGVLSGTPTTAGTSNFTVVVTDANGYAATEATSITVTGPVLSISTPPVGEVTAPYTATTLAATGGTGPYSYAVTTGSLPAGLTLNSSTGVISGTPTSGAVGTSTFTVTATDSTGATAVGETSITVIAGPALATTPPSGEVGAPYTATFAATGGTGPYTYAVTSGTLPAGLTLTAGVLSGAPTVAGTSSFTVTATDAVGGIATDATSIVVVAGPVLSTTPPSGEVGATYTTTTFAATGGTGPYTYAVTSGALPAGLTLTAGVLSGAPTVAGTSSFTVTATDAKSQTTTDATSVTVVAAPALSFTLPGADVGTAYTKTLSETGGTGPFTWSVSSGSLPLWASLNASTGVLSGTPTTTGTSAGFTVKVTDADGQFATQATSITVSAPPALVFTPLPGEVGVAYTSTALTATGGTAPFTYAVTTGGLPAGVTLSSAGVWGGAPTVSGTFPIIVTATDAAGGTATHPATLTVVADPSLTYVGALSTATLGAAYSDTLTESGGTGPFTYSVVAGSLPAGVTLSPTGVLSGTPSVTGTFVFTVGLVDADGKTASELTTLVVNRVSALVALAASVTSVDFGTTVTFTANLAPVAASGTVTFSDVPSSGPQAGQTVTLGTATLSAGTASLPIALPAFNANTVTASYGGDGTYAPVASPPVGVQVTGYQGELIVDEMRLSGPSGADDSYVELYNPGPATVPMAGFGVRSSSGASATVPANALLVLPAGHAYLFTGPDYSLSGIAASDTATTSLGTDGVQVTAPDSASTVVDAVGSAAASSGFFSGTALPTLTGSPTDQYAWVRLESAGLPVNTNDNASDFKLVSTSGGVVGGVQSTLGSPAPRATGSPNQSNGSLESTLLDPSKSSNAAPNFVQTTSPNLLTVRRTFTNTFGTTITSAVIRITSLSEANGVPEPGVATQPTHVARLRLTDPVSPTSPVAVTGLGSVTVQNLSVDSPSGASPGGGLNTTLTVPLSGGLAANATVHIAFTFDVDSGGTYWFGYDIDSLGGVAPADTAAPLALEHMSIQARAALLVHPTIRSRSLDGGSGQVP